MFYLTQVKFSYIIWRLDDNLKSKASNDPKDFLCIILQISKHTGLLFQLIISLKNSHAIHSILVIQIYFF